VIVPVGVGGKVSIFNFDGETDLIVDVLGWFPGASTGSGRVLELAGPAGSELFGAADVLVLSNGNYVVTDPRFDDGSKADVGAVYLFDGRTDRLISSLIGGSADDQVGAGGAAEVGDGEVVVVSLRWDNPAVGVHDAGAVTWFDGVTGLDATVSAANRVLKIGV
jgi:trimeric autotransporter adhesin